MRALNDREFYFLDRELLKFKEVDHDIWVRTAEVMAKNGEELVGGRGNKISKPTENTVIKLCSDVPLRNLELFKETVETFLKELTPEQREIFDLRWGQSELEWEEIAGKLFISDATIYRKRKTILKTYAKIKGIA